ncbi:TetR/AcrR family transcriptional regulator [Tistrella mobilis]|uniref:TetR/AcrR family transcriptional regulator n=1 Tax=Tistrella mobilis TaxID=171437 RepID=UPI00355641DA
MTGAKVRRTQEERSAETRDKLLYATLDVLMEAGHARLATQAVCERAGVSRGAMLHHYPTRSDLLVAAIERLLDDEIVEMRGMAASVRSGAIGLDAFVDDLWRRFSGRLFYITLEHITAARTDDDLRDALLPVVKRFHVALDDMWTEFFEARGTADRATTTVLNLTLCLLRGMGAQTVLKPDPDYYQDLLRAWKTILATLVEGRGSGGTLAGSVGV